MYRSKSDPQIIHVFQSTLMADMTKRAVRAFPPRCATHLTDAVTAIYLFRPLSTWSFVRNERRRGRFLDVHLNHGHRLILHVLFVRRIEASNLGVSTVSVPQSCSVGLLWRLHGRIRTRRSAGIAISGFLLPGGCWISFENPATTAQPCFEPSYGPRGGKAEEERSG